MLWKLFPNPTPNYLNLEFNQAYSKIEIDIQTMDGKIMISEKYYDCENVNIDLSSLSEGVYLLSSKLDDNLYFTKTFIKN